MTGETKTIFQAAASNDIEALNEALKDGGVNVRDHIGMTPLHHAALNLAFDAVTRLLEEPDIDRNAEDKFGRKPANIAGHVIGFDHDPVKRMRELIWPPSPEDLELDDDLTM